MSDPVLSRTIHISVPLKEFTGSDPDRGVLREAARWLTDDLRKLAMDAGHHGLDLNDYYLAIKTELRPIRGDEP